MKKKAEEKFVVLYEHQRLKLCLFILINSWRRSYCSWNLKWFRWLRMNFLCRLETKNLLKLIWSWKLCDLQAEASEEPNLLSLCLAPNVRKLVFPSCCANSPISSCTTSLRLRLTSDPCGPTASVSNSDINVCEENKFWLCWCAGRAILKFSLWSPRLIRVSRVKVDCALRQSVPWFLFLINCWVLG